MSAKTKESRDSPKSTTKAKDRVKPAIETGSNQTRCSAGFDLGLAMTGSMKNEDIDRIMSIQNKSLRHFARTNELLGKFNDFSSSKYDVLQHMFLQHTRLLVDLKKDLTNVFLRIRRLKVRLQKQYPEAFEATFNLRQDLEDRLEQEETSEPTYASNTKEKTINRKGKTKTKNENIEADKGTIEIHNENTGLVINEVGERNDGLSSEIKQETKILEAGKCTIEIKNENTALLNNVGEINHDLSSEIEHDKIHATNKTECSTNVKTSVTNYTLACKESEVVNNDEKSCGNSGDFQTEVKRTETVEEGNGCLGQVKDREEKGIKVVTGEFKDLQGTDDNTDIQKTTDDKCCTNMTDRKASDVDNGCTQVIEEDPGGTMGISKDTKDCQDIQGD